AADGERRHLQEQNDGRRQRRRADERDRSSAHLMPPVALVPGMRGDAPLIHPSSVEVKKSLGSAWIGFAIGTAGTSEATSNVSRTACDRFGARGAPVCPAVRTLPGA